MGIEQETATFAAGCFWGVEAAFRSTPGVTATRVGYAGGHVEEPTYKQVCGGATGHAEAVEVTFDPGRVSYDELLEVFWQNHDPTTKDRQGPDIGHQYRSAIFVHSEGQDAAARASLSRRQDVLDRPIVTEIVPAGTFWEAEDHHQQYLEKRGMASCTVDLRS